MAYLTKSRFVTGIECPTQIRFSDDKTYADARMTDPLLLALAEGGHQVGALAKCLFPRGTEILAESHEEQLEQTRRLLDQPNSVLFEAAVRHEDLFIRADVLERVDDGFNLYEVKARSINPEEPEIVGKRGGLLADFKPKLFDVAFQRHLLCRAFPGANVRSHLILVNKRATCEESGLNRRLRIVRDGRKVSIDIDQTLRDGRLARALLHVLPVDEYIEMLQLEPLKLGGYPQSFAEGIKTLARVSQGELLPPRLGSHCKRCHFYARRPDSGADGRLECLESASGLTQEQLRPGTAIDLYNSRSIDPYIAEGHLLLSGFTEDLVKLKMSDSEITNSHRQWLQVEEARDQIGDVFCLRNILKKEVANIGFPLRFLDFETARPVLPYFSSMRPYQQLFFQFSIHKLDDALNFRHESQYLDEGLEDPTIPTLRKLREALAPTEGRILHWWHHERSVLTDIRDRIATSEPGEIADSEILLQFIDSLLGVGDTTGRLFDLGSLIKKTVFYRGTRGSNSLKVVLPAVLRASEQIRAKYAEPIYGANDSLQSLNFEQQRWVEPGPNGPKDPYDLLGDRIDDPSFKTLDDFEDDEDFVADGGAAMVAFGMIMSGLMSPPEIADTRRQLLKYCELDTFAMCLAWEHIQELIR